ncbi:MAG: DUF4337 domain-containing protein [Planctomycetaceae bacterium]|nr:DUF4337 domain-containing protein [Planctomycetaceae bacterium]
MSNGDAGPATAARQRWEDWITKTTAVLAVFAALSSGQWGASNLRAILEQGKVDDGWSYYQAKSIKGHLAEHMQGMAGALAADRPAAAGQESALVKYRAELEAEAKRLSAEKAIIEKDVHGYEHQRDAFVERSFWFEIAFACLQAGVVLSTIAAATKKKGLWMAAMVAGLLGVLFVVNGLTHLVQTPEYSKKLGPKLEMKDPLQAPK